MMYGGEIRTFYFMTAARVHKHEFQFDNLALEEGFRELKPWNLMNSIWSAESSRIQLGLRDGCLSVCILHALCFWLNFVRSVREKECDDSGILDPWIPMNILVHRENVLFFIHIRVQGWNNNPTYRMH
jgi:hypothetical protein